MSTLQYCLTRRKSELPAFLRVLKALPEERMNYRPHPKSRTAAELAGVLVAAEAALVSLLDRGTTVWREDPLPVRVPEIVTTFERHFSAVNDRLARLDDAGWQKQSRLTMFKSHWDETVADFVWLFLFDAVHHRGQLSTYLRPMGARVPAIYGPSADEADAG